MQTWIHFTGDVEKFFDGLEQVENDDPSAFTEEGLFVYKWHANFPEQERSAAWGGRTAILIHCDENYVEFIQEDPIGSDPDNDEYMISIENFKHCEVLS